MARTAEVTTSFVRQLAMSFNPRADRRASLGAMTAWRVTCRKSDSCFFPQTEDGDTNLA